MAGTTVQARATGMRGSDVQALLDAHTQVIADLQYHASNRVMSTIAGGLSVDANAQDVEIDNALIIRVNGVIVAFAAQAAIVTLTSSIATVPGASTVSVNKYGAGWVFAVMSGTSLVADIQTDITTAAWTSAIQALAQYSAPTTATRLLPPSAVSVPVGVVYFLADGSAHTWGTTSITSQTETYVDFVALPGVITPMASFALDAAAATFTYGAATGVLGSGVYINFTGKTGVALPTLPATTILNNAVGAYLFYGLADDVEFPFLYGATYATLAAAQAAVLTHTRNPYLVWLGTLYIENRSGATFTPATTNLDATGIKCTFTINPGTQLTAPLITVSA